MTDLPILYSFRRCPYAMRARLAIAASGQSVALREVLLRDKPPEMIDASPKATVPVLIGRDGTVLEESLDIMLWALRRHDPHKWLQPEAGDLQAMLVLIKHMDGPFKTDLDAYKYAPRPSRRSPDVDTREAIAARDAAMAHLNELNATLEVTRYLFGQRIGLADMAIAPFVRQFANVDFDWFSNQPLAGLQRWLTDFTGSGPFAEVMNKYTPWKPKDAALIFPEHLSKGRSA